MSKRFFISDTHFGHKAILDYCERPFVSTDEMDAIMIERWNYAISKSDIVYHLGDFCFGNNDKAKKYINSLNGQKHLILGNHDDNLNKETLKLFRSVSQYKKIKFDGYKLFLCHYPMISWDGSNDDYISLYGHSHGTSNNSWNRIHVGVDTNNFAPVTIEDILKIKEKYPKVHAESGEVRV